MLPNSNSMQQQTQQSEHIDMYNDTSRDRVHVFVEILVITLVIWIILGFAGFVTSLLCFKRSGTDEQHIMGVVIAFLFGPFFWVYFMLSKNYCLNVK